ncbi:GntR family transcriptional regulator [Paractinoplanes hotanensis]|uniref:GntR family transcriptional regulator n=1 Tax=Paractinoplanes hotanensis TaxID=2906497 RepID=A0ABT0XYQ8_9ACTN|nr:GntR family transcriptional regulator [Actinoplanes hotanensis]MCM4078925.1 GntR family transcriptional regulator [Actinoplanes hotanensis]
MSDEIQEPYRHRTPRPVYVMIAEELAQEIAKAPVDSPIASENDIRQRWGVARATARHAIAELRERGLVYTVAGRGSFVSPRP